jgi:hypothetical protein
MAEHDCETYDFPVKQGSFEFTRVSKRTAEELTKTLRLAKEDAETKGTDAMKDEKCKAPCSRDIYVETTIDSIDLYQPNAGSALGPGPLLHGFVSMVVGITWQAGILCFKRAPRDDSPKKPAGHGGE